MPGFEPGAFRMQSECDTTTPRPQGVLTHRCDSPIVNYTHNSSHYLTYQKQSFNLDPLTNTLEVHARLNCEIDYQKNHKNKFNQTSLFKQV